ncbi:MAG TPA: hypothetical protein VHC44_06850 [Verrucomicrobiae bacterium]|nr:hypothetical protein [Verrucomicrobiae bacterium]
MTAAKSQGDFPDTIKISRAEAAQLLSGRMKKLKSVGIGDPMTSAEILWPKLCAWSATQTEVAE